ncbi:GTP-binding protein [Streptomyces orinoci]|uniref:GTP-binding protein n=1 Tax=Streptomyces orinoci TaxID=67339 RepID=A0ABV3JSQ1_STRON|nr:GTP-binding protein [Streptomyces orinoci]
MPGQGYARTKPHLNIGTLGAHGHGKTTLTAAIAQVLGWPPRGNAVAGPGAAAPVMEYETGTRHYAHTDLPGHPARLGRLITAMATLDAAIVVVAAPDGVRPQTAQHLLLARHLGVEHLVVALTGAGDADPGRAEAAVRELLLAHGYPGAPTPVVRVCAKGALRGEPRWTGAVEALLDAIDTCVPVPVRYTDAPFRLPVQRVLTVPGRGTVATGVVVRGTVRPGERVCASGTGEAVRVAGLETFGKPMASAQAGDQVGLLLPGARWIRRGEALAAPGTVPVGQLFTARLRLPPPSCGGRRTPLYSGYRPRCHLGTAEVTGVLDLGPGGTARPGEEVAATVCLDRPVPLEPGGRLVLREGGRTVAVGTVGTMGEWTNRYP